MLKLASNIKLILGMTIGSLWFCYGLVYLYYSANYDGSNIPGYLSLVGEAGLDLIAAVLTFILWRNEKESNKKATIYLIFFISFISAFIADTIYNITLNILQKNILNNTFVSLFDIPFIIFLTFQLLAWIKILLDKEPFLKETTILSYLPAAIAALIIFLIFIFGIPWKIPHLSLIGFYEVIDTILEVTGFALAVICLARANNQIVFYLAVGYLTIIASDLIIRNSVVANLSIAGNPLETTWVLGLSFIVLGFFFARWESKKATIWLSPINSLKSQIALWAFTLCLISINAFMLACLILSFERNTFLYQITHNLPTVFIVFSILSVISSNLISTKLAATFKKLEEIIDKGLNVEGFEIPEKLLSKKTILEFINLENFLLRSIKLHKQKHQMEIDFAIAASQVAHDIRSPLIALEKLANNINIADKNEKQIINSSVYRIGEIADSLLKRYKVVHQTKKVIDSSQSVSPEIIWPLIETIIIEKRVSFTDKNVLINFYVENSNRIVFTLVDQTIFKRVISNLLNNAIESLNDEGIVTTTVSQIKNKVQIMIEDNGCGIPSTMLTKILDDGISYGKQEGIGLGIKQAIKYIESWQGDYKIQSRLNEGTIFSLTLPVTKPAIWFIDTLYLLENTVVILFSKSTSLPKIIIDKISANIDSSKSIEYVTLNEIKKLSDYIKDNKATKKIIFIDYEDVDLEGDILNTIKNFALIQHTILVLNQYPNNSLQQKAITHKVKLLPTCLIKNMKITLVPAFPDKVLLDDSDSIVDLWKIEAIKKNKCLATFNTANIFYEFIYEFPKKTFIYIDYELNEEINGLNIAEELYHQGYKNIFLATGYNPDKFVHSSFLKGVVGKEPNF